MQNRSGLTRSSLPSRSCAVVRLSGMLGILSGSDPRQASQLATELDRGPGRTQAVGEVAAAWARKSPAEAMAWAQSLEGAEGTNAIGRALGSWSNVSPQEAVQWLDEQATPEIRNTNLPLVAGSWATREPGAAAQWVASHREGEGKGDALGLVMWNWTHQDPEAAANWLDNLPPSESRDRGIIGLATAAFDPDPAGAVIWAATIEDESLRQGTLEIGLRAWNERDPENARSSADAKGQIPRLQSFAKLSPGHDIYFRVNSLSKIGSSLDLLAFLPLTGGASAPRSSRASMRVAICWSLSAMRF